jgi:hypothetical protein
LKRWVRSSPEEGACRKLKSLLRGRKQSLSLGISAVFDQAFAEPLSLRSESLSETANEARRIMEKQMEF